jgi:hypothetical protein
VVRNFKTSYVPVGLSALLMMAAGPAHAPTSDVLTLTSPNEESLGRFGGDVAGVGDVNQDGFPDVLVGASWEDAGSSPNAGRAYLFSGRDGSLIYGLVSPNETLDGRFGSSLASPGDIDRDGVPDLLVGAAKDVLGGRAYAFSGRDGALLLELVSSNEKSGGDFGSAVAGAGDVDQDGLADIVVGAEGENPDGIGHAGRAYVFSGQEGGLLFELASPNQNNSSQFGFSVAAVGDVNRDGFADFIVGAPHEDVGNLKWLGTAYVFSGEDSSVLFQLASPNPQSEGYFGYSVAGAGDVNQDGSPDLIVGARFESDSGPSDAGRAYVFSGRDASLLFELASPNEENNGNFGFSVGGAGDVNQDGVPDCLVGAWNESPGPSPIQAGRAYVFSGRDGSTLFQLASPNEQGSGNFGSSVDSAGDANQDGSADLIVGAPEEDPDDSPDLAGRAYIFRSPYPSHINCGGPHYAALDGSLFVEDRGYPLGGFGYVGGGQRHFNQPIGGTDDDPLYQDVRIAREGDADGIFAYRFDVSSPTRYDITLYLMAPSLDGAGNVVMDVRAEEDLAFDDLDVTAEAGGSYQALVKTFAVDVNDGTLDLRFRAVNKAAVVSAIAVAAKAEARGSRVSHQLSGGQ